MTAALKGRTIDKVKIAKKGGCRKVFDRVEVELFIFAVNVSVRPEIRFRPM